MTDINSYASGLLLEFLEAADERIREVLKSHFGESWHSEGMLKHLPREALERAQKMIDAPLATVDMGKALNELHGVEHLGSVVAGNWPLFQDCFGNRNRTEVYFNEISELRHNIAHRRKHHMLRREELLRFVQNARMLLRALDSPVVNKFEAVADNLAQGTSPWGRELAGSLPPAADVVSEFVGRDSQLEQLMDWLADDSSTQFQIWGYGGSGKSALAYQFARSVRYSALSTLEAVIWLSAKKSEFIEGSTRERGADFYDAGSFVDAVWLSLYGSARDAEFAVEEGAIKELSDTPSLVIVDDLDSVLDDENLAHYLLYDIARSNSKIVYTTRQRVPGIPKLDVIGFDDQELEKFIRTRAHYYDLDVDMCLKRRPAIRSVTDGFPLFVDDLLRHAKLGGLRSAIDDWSQRKGDAAREYALRRQLSSLGETSKHALIGVAVADRPVSILELSTISGFTDDDMEHAVRDLLRWRLILESGKDAQERPIFSCNGNTRRLVEKIYGREPVYDSTRKQSRALSGSALPAPLRKRVGQTIGHAKSLVLRGDYQAAESVLIGEMVNELRDNPDLWGCLGWVLSRTRVPGSKLVEEDVHKARAAFEKARSNGSRKEDTYFHWVSMERDVAEDLVGAVPDENLLEQWRRAASIAERGIRVCGETPALCQQAAYVKTREAKTLEHLSHFTAAQNCYGQGAEWARRSLDATSSTYRDVNRSQVYRTLVLALEGAGEDEEAGMALEQWQREMGSDDAVLLDETARHYRSDSSEQ